MRFVARFAGVVAVEPVSNGRRTEHLRCLKPACGLPGGATIHVSRRPRCCNPVFWKGGQSLLCPLLVMTTATSCRDWELRSVFRVFRSRLTQFALRHALFLWRSPLSVAR